MKPRAKRGDLVIVAAKGVYTGKPRPGLILQADLFGYLGSVSVCRLSTELIQAPLFRLTVEPTPVNGLKETCQVMIDKIVTVPRDKIGTSIGALDRDTMIRVDRSVALFLGIG